MPRWTTRLVEAVLGLALLACAGEDTTEGAFTAGAVDEFVPTSITTYTDGEAFKRATPSASGVSHVLEGTLVFHLVRLESGDFLALSARDPHSDCWVPWEPEFEFQGRTGWFRDPCGGSIYDETGMGVAGPALRDLDRHPVEIREGEVHVDLAEDGVIPGVARLEPGDAGAVASVPPSRPTAATPTPTPVAATAAPSPTTTRTPTTTATPSPPTQIEGSPFIGADLVVALTTAGLGYGLQGDGLGCDGARARVEVYGTAGYGGDPTSPDFALWVYASPAALREDWELPVTGPPRPKLANCGVESTAIYWNRNLLLVLGDIRLWSNHLAAREQIAAAFLTLSPNGGDSGD